MDKLKIVLFLVAVCLFLIAVFAIPDALVKINKTTEESRLIKGEISIFEYCSHIGKVAVNDPKCSDFNRFFGPQ